MSEQADFRVALRTVIIDLFLHIVSAAIFAVLIYIATGDLVYVALVVFAAVPIDADRLLDYFLYCGSKFCFKDFLSCRYLNSGKIYLFLHSWEIDFVVLAWALLVQSPALWILFSGLSVHLAIDNLQRMNPLFYFITYRLYNKFDSNFLLPEYKIGERRFLC